jgi:23S rRNA pseudouridine1911/1915/1917 synthase
MHNFTIEASLAKTRLDKALTGLMDLSRSKLQNIIRSGNVSINGKIVQDLDYFVIENDNITVVIPEVKPVNIKPTAIPINIVYEDEDIIVIDKQAGLTVHPGAGNHDDTLVNALVDHYGKSLSTAGGEDRPGIVHRLDRDTSGLMVIAKNDVAHVKLSAAIAERHVQRYYKAFVWGNIVPPEGTITTNIARGTHDRTRMRVVHPPSGKIATTHYATLSSWQYVSLVECKLDTGRTHQIRVHLSHVGHSVIGDQIYGQNARKISYYASGALKQVLATLKRQALHSYKLEFKHPSTGKNMSFVSELPEDLQQIISIL